MILVADQCEFIILLIAIRVGDHALIRKLSEKLLGVLKVVELLILLFDFIRIHLAFWIVGQHILEVLKRNYIISFLIHIVCIAEQTEWATVAIILLREQVGFF